MPPKLPENPSDPRNPHPTTTNDDAPSESLPEAEPDPSPSSSVLEDALDRLLRGGRRQGVFPDGDGWVRIDHLTWAVSRTTARRVRTREVQAIVGRTTRFEITRQWVRVLTDRPSLRVPDILFAPVPQAARHAARHLGRIGGDARGGVLLCSEPEAAWALAHQHLDDPDVLVVDGARARRAGVRFSGAGAPGRFRATPIPTRFVLDLRPEYGEQHSAGGLPVMQGSDGAFRLLLVRVERRSGVTWEVAKGKLEPGESPEMTAVREVGEETGLRNPIRVVRHLEDVRYGFLAPGGRPRLKTVYLYLMAVDGDTPVLAPPAEGEGIADVGWFTPDEAAAAVRHPSLIPALARARDVLGRYGLAPDRGYGSPDAAPR